MTKSLSEDDRKKITVKRAYRLGSKRLNAKYSRKILIELADSTDRDFILSQSKIITKVGNEGRPYYINEDVSDEVKRRKADLHKYVNYLKYRGHTVEKAGDDIILNGIKWKSVDFNRLPVGDRILDSRTVFWKGSVAFQSALSPLSNLFPCVMFFKGIRYTSLEQAYQHLRTLHHQRYDIARDIMALLNPYDIMNQGKEYSDNEDWLGQRLPLMESLVRHKLEQVPIFADTLRSTGSHLLVENTFNPFWGSGCTFQSPLVWNASYPGQNHLGRILERVRSSV